MLAFDDPQAHGISLSLAESTPLATALAHSLARRAQVRVLTLKGPQAAADGLRPPRPSYDVDLLIDPTQLDQYMGVLAQVGWEARPTSGFPVLLSPHSVSLTHPGWSVDIDLHWNWPGYLSPDASVFEELWSNRRTEILAGAPVTVTGMADSALILALHVLRESSNLTSVQRRAREYDYLVEFVNRDPALRAAIPERARLLHAERTAEPFLSALGFETPQPQPLTPESERQLREWRLHQGADHAVAGWVHQIRQAPLWLKPVVAWQAVFPSPAALRAIDPFIGDGALELSRGWWRRTRRGLRTARSASRSLQSIEQENAS